jgi:hypothetical protein
VIPGVSASSKHLTLIVPGLAGPDSDPPVTDYFRTRPAELDRWLSRSRRARTGRYGLAAALCHCFGIHAEASLPVAALTWLADCNTPPPPNLLRADPVHLRADQSCLRLFESHSVTLTQVEAALLQETVQAFIAPYGWQLSAPDPQRWYLALPHPPALITHAPVAAAGADIDPFLPSGMDAMQWHAVMNELQMLLHDHPVNLARAERGEAAINSLWFWGNGALPASLPAPARVICSGQALARGLARHAGIACREVPACFTDWQADPAPLVVLDVLEWPQAYRDIDSWLEHFEQLEASWLRPAASALRNGQLATLVLDACNGYRWRSGRWRRYGFWCAVRPFEAVLRS